MSWPLFFQVLILVVVTGIIVGSIVSDFADKKWTYKVPPRK